MQCHYAECCDLFIVMLNAVMLSDIMLIVFILNAVMLNVVAPYIDHKFEENKVLIGSIS